MLPKNKLYFIFSCFSFSAYAYASEPASDPFINDFKKYYWTFGINGVHHKLHAKNEFHSLNGNAFDISIGGGKFDTKLFTFAEFQIKLGPYEESPTTHLDIDHQGTGFSLWTGYPLVGGNLRNSHGSYGLAFALHYFDLTGTSIGLNKRQTGNAKASENENLINEYKIRVSNFAVVPAFFAAWLDEPRPKGNTPELLKTRNEGFILTLGAALPIKSKYNVQYVIKKKENMISGGNVKDVEESETDSLKGFSIILNLTALIGI